MKKLLVLVPSRKRYDKIVDFYQYFKQHSHIADLCIGLDDDDAHNYPKFENVIYDINTNLCLNDKLNLLATKHADKYQYLGFLGDDHWVRTPNWDSKMIEAIENITNGIAYGNDLIQGELLPTAVILDSRIVRVLGYMAPPKQRHLYLDNFWKDLGQALGTLRYVEDTIIEHMHFTVGKSEIDELYIENNATERFNSDRKLYEEYIQNDFTKDIIKLKSELPQ